MQETTVVNLRTVRVSAPNVVNIGRRNGRYKLPESKWHNPYRIGPDGDRAQVIDKYREYIQTRPDLLAALPELAGKRLACWCAPEACHGDVLIELLNSAKD